MKFWKALFKATIGTIAPAEERQSRQIYAQAAPEAAEPAPKQETRMQDVTAPEVAETVSVKPMEVSASIALEPKRAPRKRVKKQPIENSETQTLS